MLKKKKYPRHKNPRDRNFHGKDRTLTRRLIASENYDALPMKESFRKAVYRGPNAHGDNCSFGYYHSGMVTWKFLEKLLEEYVGKEFSVYYSKMTAMFPSGKERDYLDWYIKLNFNLRFGWLPPSYVIVDGKIEKNPE